MDCIKKYIEADVLAREFAKEGQDINKIFFAKKNFAKIIHAIEPESRKFKEIYFHIDDEGKSIGVKNIRGAFVVATDEVGLSKFDIITMFAAYTKKNGKVTYTNKEDKATLKPLKSTVTKKSSTSKNTSSVTNALIDDSKKIQVINTVESGVDISEKDLNQEFDRLNSEKIFGVLDNDKHLKYLESIASVVVFKNIGSSKKTYFKADKKFIVPILGEGVRMIPFIKSEDDLLDFYSN